MKLAYHIPNKLYWIHDFLPYEQYKRIHSAIHKERKKLSYISTKGTWEPVLHKNLRPIEHVVVDNKYFSFYETFLRHNPIHPIDGEIPFLIYKWGHGAGINWHGDANHTYGITYYINRRWNQHWGGEFMFKDNNQHGFIPVRGNSVIIVKNSCEHKVNPVLSPIVPRLTIQIFIS